MWFVVVVVDGGLPGSGSISFAWATAAESHVLGAIAAPRRQSPTHCCLARWPLRKSLGLPAWAHPQGLPLFFQIALYPTKSTLPTWFVFWLRYTQRSLEGCKLLLRVGQGCREGGTGGRNPCNLIKRMPFISRANCDSNVTHWYS